MPQTFDNIGHCAFSVCWYVACIQSAFSPAEAHVVPGPVRVGKHLKMTKCSFKTKLPTKICIQIAHVVVLMFFVVKNTANQQRYVDT